MKRHERQERERDERRQAILDAASHIAAEEGLERLSIRKIAERIEYSPGIIYHYFSGKEAIVEQLLQQHYQQFVSELSAASAKETPPELVFSQTMRRFIETTLADGSSYRNIMLNESPSVLSHTAVLFRGASEQRAAIGMLCGILRNFESMRAKKDSDIELTAQIVWSAAFGLILRLTVEKEIPAEQREKLIDGYIELMLAAVADPNRG
ncbi:TetR/AcrR family transcriptional regulator [Paenibacillus rhizophilus]|uniref:TetR/AcrR family transcriptional regulator n=1 Tax=Paenibacillus rhizophilus TaxID=1850366 RepID=A0A3N9PBS4_9BACL|nr:TetR/AcrR family transcriptional regulator [Paenibacillus rhizophilus]RQW13329.1 TetR/AcrR family transcriptional regulator [Paenibacillus rhizophilus]